MTDNYSTPEIEFPATEAEVQSRKAQIEQDTQRVFNMMLEADKNGIAFEDALDAPSIAALRKMTNLAVSTNPEIAANSNRVVPSVESGGRGYDLYSMLLRERIILLEGQVDDGMASVANASILFLTSKLAEKRDEPIQVYINSPGGSVLAGMSIYDTLRSVKAKIVTVGTGMQASMGSILLASGDERYMTRHSNLMLHQLSSGNNQSQLTDLAISHSLSQRLHEELKSVYVRHIGLTYDFWDIVMVRDTWFTAQMAEEMGYIDGIIMGEAKPAPHEKYAQMRLNQVFNTALLPGGKIPATAEGIILELSKSAPDNAGDSLRPVLLTALSKFEQFWTPSLHGKRAVATLAETDVEAAKQFLVSENKSYNKIDGSKQTVTLNRNLLGDLADKWAEAGQEVSQAKLLAAAAKGVNYVRQELGMEPVKLKVVANGGPKV